MAVAEASSGDGATRSSPIIFVWSLTPKTAHFSYKLPEFAKFLALKSFR